MSTSTLPRQGCLPLDADEASEAVLAALAGRPEGWLYEGMFGNGAVDAVCHALIESGDADLMVHFEYREPFALGAETLARVFESARVFGVREPQTDRERRYRECCRRWVVNVAALVGVQAVWPS